MSATEAEQRGVTGFELDIVETGLVFDIMVDISLPRLGDCVNADQAL